MVRGVIVCVCVLTAAAADGLERPGAAGPPPRALPGPGFPVGVVLSDRLYPLVVGRDLETGAPFVANLDRQHALVVARGGAEGYRMLIPFPAVVGSPPHDPSEGRSLGRPSSPYYPSYGRGPPKKYSLDARGRGKYYDESPDARGRGKYYDESPDARGRGKYYDESPDARGRGKYYDESLDTQVRGKYYESTRSDHASNPLDAYASKVPSDASDYRSHRDYHSDGADKYADSRYKHSPPKKYAQQPEYINYFGVDRKPPPVVTGKYVPFSIDRPVSKYRVKNYTRYLGPEGDLSYRVAGPKYAAFSPFSREYGSHGATSASPSDAPRIHRDHGSPDGGSGFKPSPYLGSIPDDEPSTPAPLEPHSEEFESYDDREPDYIETTSGSSGRAGPATVSSGGVRHVTHHADDYLGKIYEDMYYKVAPGTYSDGPPNYEEALESRQRNATTDTRTGPVTFDGAATEAD